MNIGKKIRDIRNAKMMTQSELAGDEITRNMLSRIENNAANPSLSTIKYLASKLGVPTGYLLSEGDEEFIYNKTGVMKNIKKAYVYKDYEMCLEMCISSFDEYDDELELIMADCCVGVAEECIRDGKLHKACVYLDEAIVHAQRTMYQTVTQMNRILVMFSLMKDISAALDSNEIDTEISEDMLHPSLFGDVFCKYITALTRLDRYGKIPSGLFDGIGDVSEYDKLFILHLGAREKMHGGEYKKASEILVSVMDGETVPQRLLLYLTCSDMEICCREMEDYKGAYEFSQNKMEILEHMLVES